MASETKNKIEQYKELLDSGLISEEKYYEFVERLINSSNTMEPVEQDFNTKREELIQEQRQKSKELKERINNYEEQARKEYERKERDDRQEQDVAFAISFLSQIRNSLGERVYSDEVLEDAEKGMPLYEMLNLIEEYKNNAPEMYNEIVKKVDPSKVIENSNNTNEPVEQEETKAEGVDVAESNEALETNEEINEEVTGDVVDVKDFTDLPDIEANENQNENQNEEQHSDETIASDMNEISNELKDLNNQNNGSDFEQFKEDYQEAKNEGKSEEEIQKEKDMAEARAEIEEMSRAENPKRPKKISQAGEKLRNLINDSNSHVISKIAKAAVAVGLIAGGIAVGAAVIAGGGLAPAVALTGGLISGGAIPIAQSNKKKGR